MSGQVNSGSERLTIGTWLALAAAAILLLGNVAQIAYRHTLPTDGWAVISDEAVEGN